MVPVFPELKGGRYGTPSATIRKVPANWDELVTLSLSLSVSAPFRQVLPHGVRDGQRYLLALLGDKKIFSLRVPATV